MTKRVKKTKQNSFWGKISKFKRKKAEKLSTTFFRVKKIIISFVHTISWEMFVMSGTTVCLLEGRKSLDHR